MNKIKKFLAIWIVTVTLAPIIGGLAGGATYGVGMLFTESSSEVTVDLSPSLSAGYRLLDANEQLIDRFAVITLAPGADTLEDEIEKLRTFLQENPDIDDYEEGAALEVLVGPKAEGLSASTVSRLHSYLGYVSPNQYESERWLG